MGKGTLIAALLEARDDVELSVSATTRPPRAGETNGVEYTFLSEAEFRRRVEAGDFLEHATYAGRLYGTPRSEVERRLDAGQSVIMEIEIEGARQVARAMPDAVQVFVAPPSVEELERRLVDRGTDLPADIAARLAAAKGEIAAADEFDRVIVNDDRTRAARELIDFVSEMVG